MRWRLLECWVSSAATTDSKPRHHAHHHLVLAPGLRRLRADLGGALGKAGPNTGAAVYDLTTHRLLFTLRPNSIRPPASVEKLYTTVALLRRLKPGYRVHTTVLGTTREPTWTNGSASGPEAR